MEITTEAPGTPTQTCRTCMHNHDPFWAAGLKTIAKAREEGRLGELACDTGTPVHIRKIRSDGSLVAMSDKSRPVRAADIDAHGTETGPVIVNTCGHQIAPKCRNCARLRTVSVRIPHPTYEGSKAEVILVASCSIPDEGIKIGNRTVTCAPKRINRLARITSNCETCRYRFTTEGHWLDERGGVIDVDLTPYEMEVAKRNADPTRIGIAIEQARMRKNQSPRGRTIPYGVDLAEKDGQLFIKFRASDLFRPNAAYWAVELDDENVVSYASPKGTFSGLIPPGQVVLDRNGDTGVIYLKAPWYETFGLTDRLTRRPLLYGPMPKKVHKAKRSPEDYFAAKAPRWSTHSDLVELHAPTPRLPYIEPRRDLFIVDGEIVTAGEIFKRFLEAQFGRNVVFDTDPAPALLRLRAKDLVAQADRLGCGDSVRAQLRTIMGRLVRGRYSRDITPSWNAPTTLEPYQDYCSLNLADPSRGLDFRDLFGDSFGMDRSQYSRTLTHAMERDQFERIHAPGNAVQAEIMTTDKADPQWPSFTGSGRNGDEFNVFDDTEGWTKRVYDILGEELDLEGGDHPVDEEFYRRDVAEFMNWLDEPVTRTDTDGYDHHSTHRMQRYGYTIHRASGSDAAPGITFAEDEDHPGDRIVCPACDAVYGMDILESTLACIRCGESLHVVETGGGDGEARRRVGIGTAIAADTASFQNRARLRATVCDSWAWRTNPSITLGRVAGPDTGAKRMLEHEDLRISDLRMYAEMGIDPTFVGGSTTGGYSHSPVSIRPRVEPKHVPPYHAKYNSL